MRKLIAVLLAAAVLCGCTMQKQYAFTADAFEEKDFIFDAVSAVYCPQEYIKNVYEKPVVTVLDDGMISRDRVLYADRGYLYLVQQIDEDHYVLGSYNVQNRMFNTLFDSSSLNGTEVSIDTHSVSRIYGLPADRYLMFCAAQNDDSSRGALCCYDTVQQKIQVVARRIYTDEVQVRGKSIYYLCEGENQETELCRYIPASEEIEIKSGGNFTHLILFDGQILYTSDETGEDGEELYYTFDGQSFPAQEGVGLPAAGDGSLVATGVDIHPERYSKIAAKLPEDYRALPCRSKGLEVTTAKEPAPLLLPLGDAELTGLTVGQNIVGLHMKGDYLPRFYDAQRGVMVIVGQLTGHDFSYQTYIDSDRVYIVTDSVFYNAEGAESHRQKVYVVEIASLGRMN